MGQTLSEPMTEKVSDDGFDDRTAFGVSAMQGWRISMEDAHATILDLQPESKEPFASASPESRLSFFGVYDGHGGDRVAQFTGENLHKILARQEAFKAKKYEQALRDCFLGTDRAILSDRKYEDEVSGCTASVGLITNDTIFVANAGDSRSVLGAKGQAIPLSYDHKPQNEGEKARICAAGGFVEFGRVNGNLALSRAVGDFEFKKRADLAPEQQIVTAFPDVSSHTITDDDEFLVVACDGIWDCQSSQAVVEFVRRGIAERQPLSLICENMMDNCLASSSETGGVGCDNMTMIVIALLRGKTKDQWYDSIVDRVANGDGPVAPPEFAQVRAPGVRSSTLDDISDETELGVGQARRGRVILLGDSGGLLSRKDVPEDDEDTADDNGESYEYSSAEDLEDTSHTLQESATVPVHDEAEKSVLHEQDHGGATNTNHAGASTGSGPQPSSQVSADTTLPDKTIPS